ncbi:MAG: hypothetical protein CMJ78_17515 [Planctomycetaceae bacterium]|nr:hypothetical protein [Planctomycetaceae bacterium]
MTAFHLTGDALWERMDRAVEKVRARLERTTTCLEQAGIPYAVSGGHAVRAWVAQVDEAAVRTTRDVDILLRREDLPAAVEAMEQIGFVYRKAAGIDMFLDGEAAKPRDSVHLLFANEKVQDNYATATPDVDESTFAEGFRVVELEALVRMKLTSFRRKDQMHLLDMIDVELIDASWVTRYPTSLGERLQELLDDPQG